MREKPPLLEMVRVWGENPDDFPKGKRVLIEGLDSDTPYTISCLPTFSQVEIPQSVGNLIIHSYNYRFWPPMLGLRDQLTINEGDLTHLKYIGAARTLVLEDGRMFVREYELDNFDYMERYLPEVVRVALERFGQCAGAGFFRINLKDQ